MRELLFVAGARPNFVKIAPLLRAFSQVDNSFRRTLVHTGQHYDELMSDVFFEQLRIPKPDVYLGIGSGSHGAQTGKILIEFEKLLLSRDRQSIAGVIVVGDVNSTVACALAAVKLGVPVAHIEAGLRSFDREMPEEINRLLTDAVADLLFVTEESGVSNLLREGVDPGRISLVGNVMIDTLMEELPRAQKTDILSRVGVQTSKYALATIHRPSNVDTDTRLAEVIGFLERVSGRLPVVFPVHPRTRKRMEELPTRRFNADGNLKVIGPVGYHENLQLMSSAMVVLTDSGGMQEETSALRVPCLTLRKNTERPSTVELGTSTLVGDDLQLAERLVDDVLARKYKQGAAIPYWDGRAAERIAKTVIDRWS